MPLSSVSRRRWLIAALVPLALAGCSALQTGPRHLDISEAQLLSRIAARFPVKQRYLGLFEVTLEQPRLRLLPEENRLGTEVDYLLGLPLPGQSDVKGKIELSYGLRFEPSDTTLRLTQARVERLGDQTRLHLRLDGHDIVTLTDVHTGLEPGDTVAIRPDNPLFFDARGARIAQGDRS